MTSCFTRDRVLFVAQHTKEYDCRICMPDPETDSMNYTSDIEVVLICCCKPACSAVSICIARGMEGTMLGAVALAVDAGLQAASLHAACIQVWAVR